jgi:MFS family permease
VTSPPARIDQSYRGLLRVPQLSRVLASMMVARTANAMVGVAIILFTLEAYDSPALAGLVTLAYILPGILVSPIAGALLDRHGRVRLIILDYIVSGSTLGLIALLALADSLPAALLVLIAALASLTSILSATGLRSLFPIMVPKQLWERVNAVDSNGYIVATILGPPIAAALVTIVGGPPTLAIIGGLMLLATIPLIGVRDPAVPKPAEAPLLHEAWDGVLYVWHNPTLRGLAFSISTLNIAGGVASIAIPLLVLRQLGFSPTLVGLAFAVSGITGVVSSAFFGRFDTRGREWRMLVVPMVLTIPTVALLLPVAASAPAGTAGGIEPLAGIALVIASQALFGILNGPLDIALFTVRQRRTDPAIMGRAFAVSMAANFTGYPVGSAIAGVLASVSLVAPIWLGIVACVLATVFAIALIPRHAPAAPMPASASLTGTPSARGADTLHPGP